MHVGPITPQIMDELCKKMQTKVAGTGWYVIWETNFSGLEVFLTDGRSKVAVCNIEVIDGHYNDICWYI